MVYLGIGAVCIILWILWRNKPRMKMLDVAGEFVHPSGNVFPIQVGPFLRDQLIQYDRSGRNISAAYNFLESSFWIAATIYVYPANGSLENEFQNSMSQVCQYSPVKGVFLKGPFSLPVKGSEKKGFQFAALIVQESGGQFIVQYSWLMVFQKGDWLIKFRFTFPLNTVLEQGLGEELESAARQKGDDGMLGKAVTDKIHEKINPTVDRIHCFLESINS